jgi:transcriptional regulator with XRE-family HTH domain
LIASEANAAAEMSALAREVQRMNTQEATFAHRVRELMETKRISQQELADRVGCSQPAISQMLNRSCRPQKKTILKIAEALQVQARDLWPDIDVAEMLDAVASFQQSDYVMTEAEALAISDTSRTTRPRIQAKLLPTRRR